VVTLVAAVYAPPAVAPLFYSAFVGEFGLGATGAITAATRGGDVGSGLLFGVTAGALSGLALGAMGPTASAAWAGGHEMMVGATMGAVAGTFGGATSGYAGGKGSIQSILFRAAIGNITGAALGAIAGGLNAANPSKQAVNNVDPKTAEALSERAKSDLALMLKEMRSDLNVDKCIEIAELNKWQKLGLSFSHPKAQLVVGTIEEVQRIESIKHTADQVYNMYHFDIYGTPKPSIVEPFRTPETIRSIHEGQINFIQQKQDLLGGH